MNVHALKGLILKKFYTIQAFANEVGWKRNKASRIINGIQEPSNDDVVVITEALGLNEQEFFEVFFSSLSTLCTKAEN